MLFYLVRLLHQFHGAAFVSSLTTGLCSIGFTSNRFSSQQLSFGNVSIGMPQTVLLRMDYLDKRSFSPMLLSK